MNIRDMCVNMGGIYYTVGYVSSWNFSLPSYDDDLDEEPEWQLSYGSYGNSQ